MTMWPFSSNKKDTLTRMIITEKNELPGTTSFDSIKSNMAKVIIPALIKEMINAGIYEIEASWYSGYRWNVQDLEKLRTNIINKPSTSYKVNSHKDARALVTFVDSLIARTIETKEQADIFRIEAKRIEEASKKLREFTS